MIPVYLTFDVSNRTWNVMSLENECLYYGDIWQAEDWLIENKSTHEEEVQLVS